MKNKIATILLLSASLGLGSCSDYLDMSPTDKASDKLVWSKFDYAQEAVNDFYRYVGYLGTYGDGQCLAGMTEALTDELKYGSYNYMSKCQIPSEIAYGGPVLTASYTSTYLGNWGNMYEYVRRVNEGLNKLKKYASFGAAEQQQLEAEMRFFRGFLYTDLVKRYKEVIIYDDNLDNIKKNMPVSSEADGWNFVYADLIFAAEHLPVDKTPNGRVTSGTAYAMLSRSMLYAKRWDDSRIAAEKVMDMGYQLESKENYLNAFKAGSIEAIFQYCYDKGSTVTHEFDGYMSPGGDKALDGNSMTGGYGTPTQEMVESYEFADGTGFPDWSEWHTADGTLTIPPYDKLEPRFDATILYNGSSWKGRTIEPYVNGVDGWAAWKIDAKPEGRSTTGYYLRKLVDESHNFTNIQASTQPWTEFRYAEILLNHAEACYRLNDFDKANKDIKDIRERVGLPYTNKSGDELFKSIRQERKVELSYEGHYYWDMKRWGLAESAFTGIRLHGFKIEQNANGTFTYHYVECDDKDRNFPAKMYRVPMPQSELDNNGDVNQYPEWL